MTGLHARNIKKIYQERPVLDVDISFQSGNLYAILGPNGSGKSTLLQILSLVRKPDHGDVIITDVNGEMSINMELRRRIVLVPDRQGLFNDSALDNVLYGLKIRKVTKDKRNSIAEESLKSVDLWGLRKTNALSLSNGEAQRLCLAMALALNPDIILLDEPTASLDPQNGALVEKIIMDMKNTTKMILLVTHSIFQAKRLADQVLFLYQGKILEKKKKDTFFDHPKSDVVKQFLSGELVF